MIKINEIFFSIQGESSYAGWPTVFVRTSGCNLRCHYCDTKYSYYEGDFLSEQQILDRILNYNPKYVCVTGGEPLLQKNILPLLTKLCDLNLFVSLETSGSRSLVRVDPRVKIILDVKTPDSGEAGSFLEENLKGLNPSTEFKFVICSEKDFEWSIDFCRQHDLWDKFTVLFSPSWGQIDARWLAEAILKKNLPIRLQLQQHKYIWSADQRGV
jgi:7-carboxy-7-deazaguanine synthase